jgi:hypothetical protein
MMMYLANRDTAARIKERANKKKKRRRSGRPRLFDYSTYSKIISSIEDSLVG